MRKFYRIRLNGREVCRRPSYMAADAFICERGRRMPGTYSIEQVLERQSGGCITRHVSLLEKRKVRPSSPAAAFQGLPKRGTRRK